MAKNYGKLVKKIITDKNGKRRTVYVDPDKGKPSKEGKSVRSSGVRKIVGDIVDGMLKEKGTKSNKQGYALGRDAANMSEANMEKFAQTVVNKYNPQEVIDGAIKVRDAVKKESKMLDTGEATSDSKKNIQSMISKQVSAINKFVSILNKKSKKGDSFVDQKTQKEFESAMTQAIKSAKKSKALGLKRTDKVTGRVYAGKDLHIDVDRKSMKLQPETYSTDVMEEGHDVGHVVIRGKKYVVTKVTKEI